MIRIVNKLANWKNFDKTDLFQQAYIYFIYFCEQYDPYWGNGFIPFDKYLFKNMIIKLRAFIQRFYVKRRREAPIELSDINDDNNEEYAEEIVSNDIEYADSRIYQDNLYNRISKRQRQIVELTLQGYKQQEIGKILKISQSRVSVIKKRTLVRLQQLLASNGEEKEEMSKEEQFLNKPHSTRMEF